MTDYLDLLLSAPEEDEEEPLELGGSGYGAAASFQDSGGTGRAAPIGAEVSPSAPENAAARDTQALSGVRRVGPSGAGERDTEKVSRSAEAFEHGTAQEAARLERAARRRILPQTETAAETPGQNTASGAEAAERGVFALSGAMGALRRSAVRAQRLAGEPYGRETAESRALPLRETAADPVLLVDAALERDARRYDGALGLY